MQLINTNRGIIAMADDMDFILWKAQKAWELAKSIIPNQPAETGAWTDSDYLKKAQEELTKACEIVATVFSYDKLNK